MLASLLSAHPEITCFGELMNKKRSNWTRSHDRTQRGSQVDPKFRDYAVRFAEPKACVEEVMLKRANKPIVGFKLMLPQHPDFMAELIADSNFSKILIDRKNLLAAFSSNEIVKMTGQGSAKRGAEVKSAKIAFREDEFHRFVKRRQRYYADVREKLAASGQAYRETEYLDLVSYAAIPGILIFLGADPAVRLQPTTVKRNPNNILERFTNPAEVQTFLEAHGTEHWAVEGSAAIRGNCLV